jgi:hypothetical protein
LLVDVCLLYQIPAGWLVQVAEWQASDRQLPVLLHYLQIVEQGTVG